MKNFPIIASGTGKEYWISRSIAVLVAVYAKDKKGNLYVLTVKRGKGTPDPEFVGKYCLPCGYLDFDETIKEAGQRELKEETGINIDPTWMTLVYINDDPKSDKRQNITFRYQVSAQTSVDELKKQLTTKYAEPDEVESVQFIPLKDIDKYEWAFNHDQLLKRNLR